jgi:hypothetical protein
MIQLKTEGGRSMTPNPAVLSGVETHQSHRATEEIPAFFAEF